MVKVYIGLGSNLADPVQQVKQALATLAQLPNTQLITTSSLYRSRPLDGKAQPDYVNAVAVLRTTQPPVELLDSLHTIEAQQGRVRGNERWSSRTLDLDILLYGSLVSDDPHLTLPHLGLRERAFVLYPLAECEPDLVLPDGTRLPLLLEQCPMDGLHRMTDV